MINNVQQDLFHFTDQDPEDFAALAEFWYLLNARALATALSLHKGLKFVLDLKSFDNFEPIAKRLFLVADTLIIRDGREWGAETGGYCEMLAPTGPYKPEYFEAMTRELAEFLPPPLSLLNRPPPHWTSTQKTLKTGRSVAYAFAAHQSIPSEVISWLSGVGRAYLESGQVVYAPFIPPVSLELEFLKNQVDFSRQFGATSLFHQSYDWISESQFHALMSLKVPFFDGVDIKILQKIKNDNWDAFSQFSCSLTNALSSVKSAWGTEEFTHEVRNIQRNLVDAALSDVDKAVARINKSRALRKQGILTGFIGLNAAAFMGTPATTLVTGLTAGAAALVAERVAQLREKGELADKEGYFLWQLKNSSASKKF